MPEAQTLHDPWIRCFLCRFVLVKAYEDRAVEKEFGLNGYPTLVFVNAEGEAKHKCVGFMPTIQFAQELEKALKAIHEERMPQMQTLIDKKVLCTE